MPHCSIEVRTSGVSSSPGEVVDALRHADRIGVELGLTDVDEPVLADRRRETRSTRRVPLAQVVEHVAAELGGVLPVRDPQPGAGTVTLHADGTTFTGSRWVITNFGRRGTARRPAAGSG